MAKLKLKWEITDIPKDTKIKLWHIMKDNKTYRTFTGYASKHFDELFTTDETNYAGVSRATYKALKDEILLMPKEEVKTLPDDLQAWIQQLRPELKDQMLEGETKAKAEPEGGPGLPASFVAEKLMEHQDRLSELAKAMDSSLGFRFHRCGYVRRRTTKYLLQHLDFEFSRPKFSERLQRLEEALEEAHTKQLKNGGMVLFPVDDLLFPKDDLLPEVTGLASNLRNDLCLVIERGTFKGKCDICKDW